MQHAVLKFDKGLRRGASHFDIRSREVEHVRRRIDGPEHPVRIQKASLKRCREAVRKDDLEDVSLVDVMLGLLNHLAILFFRKQRGDLPEKPSRRFLLLLAVPQKLFQLLDVPYGFPVIGFGVVRLHIGDQDNFLPYIVKCDDLIEQHQVDVPELLRVGNVPPDARLAVSEIIVGEIPHQSAGERRKVRKPGASVMRKHFS